MDEKTGYQSYGSDIEIEIVPDNGRQLSVDDVVPALFAGAEDNLNRRLSEAAMLQTVHGLRPSTERYLEGAFAAFTAGCEELADNLTKLGAEPYDAIERAKTWFTRRIRQRYGGIAALAYDSDVQKRLLATIDMTASRLFRDVRAAAVDRIISDALPHSPEGLRWPTTPTISPDAPFPQRANWVHATLRQLKTSKTAVAKKFRGPELRSLNKILRGEKVTDAVVDRLYDVLNVLDPEIQRSDLPDC